MLTQYANSAQNLALRYAIGGFASGMIFPLVGLFVEVVLHDAALAPWTWPALYVGNPVHLVIATAPVVMATLFYQVGRRQAEIEAHRAELERRVEQRTAELRSLLRTIPDTMYHLRGDGTYLDYHAPDAFHLYVPPDQFMGRKIRDVLPPEIADAMTRGVRDALSSSALQTVEYDVDDMGVRHTYEARIVPCGPDQVLSIVRDITPLTEAAHLKEAFVTAVNHELRTPLTAIQGAIRLLHGGMAGQLNPETRQLVEIVSDNTLRLGQLIDDVLDLERMESGASPGPMQALDLTPLVYEAARRLEHAAARRQIAIRVRCAHSALPTFGDPRRLSRVLNVLLSNAVKFSEAGGEVSLRVSQADGWIRVEVEDCGPGVPGPFRDRIFQPFSQARGARQQGGVGLGLALARHIVERHGGRIGFLSQTDRGATFFFTLPLSDYRRVSTTLP